MLITQDLSHTYGGSAKIDFPDIHCQKGEHWLLLGQSGSGKTTLLHLLGGLLSPQKGRVEVNGQDLKKISTSKLDQFRGKHIGIIFQKAHFVKSVNVEQNLMLAQQLAGLRPDKKRIHELLDRLNVVHKLKSKPDRLSIGEQQRVAIARALVNQPGVILADEPTSALDDYNCEEVIKLIEEQAKDVDATLLVVTHDGRLKERFPKQIILS